MAKLGQIKSGTMRVGNTTASGYGIVYADEIIGHRRVNTYTDLANIPDWCLYNKAGGETKNEAIGQLWYVTTGDTSGHFAGLYQLTSWSNDTKTWTFFKNGAYVSTHDTTYAFANGSNGSFTVTPKGGTAQTVSIGKPATAGTADHAKTADSATKADSATSATNATNATNAGHATSADSATSATKATQDKNGRDIVDTYATKSQVSALSSALVYRGTVDAKYALPTKNVKVGDVYVVAAAGTFAGQTCEPGDMIIAQTASNAEGTPAPTWTVVQTNINGAVTTTENLTASKLIVGNSNKSIKVATGSGLVKLTEGVVSYDNNTYLTTTNASSTYATKTALNGKVDKVTGKGLSTNDFTAAYKTKLDGIATNANNTVVDDALKSDSTNPVQNKVVNDALSTKASKNETISSLTLSRDDDEIFVDCNKADGSKPSQIQIPLADYNILSDELITQKAGLVTGAERKAINMLSLIGSSVVNSGLRLTLGGVMGDNNAIVTIPFATSNMDDVSYGLIKGSDKKKLDAITSIPEKTITDLF